MNWFKEKFKGRDNNLNKLRDFVGLINKNNGFHPEEKPNIGELVALIASETSEMLEADRINKHSDINIFNERMDEIMDSLNPNLYYEESQNRMKIVFKQQFKNHIKEGLEAELVDCLIRCFDTAYRLNIDLDRLFDLITYHNSIRGSKHNKLY